MWTGIKQAHSAGQVCFSLLRLADSLSQEHTNTYTLEETLPEEARDLLSWKGVMTKEIE